MRFFLIFSILLYFQCGGGNRTVNTVSLNDNGKPVSANVSNKNNAMEDKLNSDDVIYDINVKKADNFVEITYKLTNKSKKSFLIFNRGDTNKGLGAGRVYVEPLENGTVELSQKRFTQPAGKSCPNFEIAVTAGANWLKPGETVTQTVKTGLPLKVYSPFDVCEPKPEMPENIREVRFCIGIAEADAEKVSVNDKGFVENWQVVGEQKLLCSKTVAL